MSVTEFFTWFNQNTKVKLIQYTSVELYSCSMLIP